MSDTAPTIDSIMEEATALLMDTRYLDAERRCLDALRLAREQGAFNRYARILMPLQEARRLRRQTATEAGVVVLAGPREEPGAILDNLEAGCVILLPLAYTADDATALRDLARERNMMAEVLYMDTDDLRAAFEQQMERAGDAALAAVPRNLSPIETVDALAAVVESVGDHEIAHQRLERAAEEAARSK